MIRYCLETHADSSAVIHQLDCEAYDLGTLLGLGCVVDLGEYRTTAEALAAVERSHPSAVRCRACCKADIVHLPLKRQNTLPAAIARPTSCTCR